MAIYHFSTKVISRADGRSAVAAAAYRAAQELEDEKLGRSHDFTAKAGVVHSEILLPEGAPERFCDRSTLWNAVEAGEKRKDAQLARDIEISLPRELPKAEAIRLIRDFVQEQFVDRGMIADLNVHWARGRDGELQPHAHVMLTMREVGPDGFGKKVRDWNQTELLQGWRERWAELANERLCELGHDVRIDHRSYAEQGIDLEPQNKIGPAGMRREDRGENAERAAEHLEIARRNGEKILEMPEIALDALTRQQSTFTRQDLARFIDRHSADAEQFAAVLAKVEASPELVRLGEDGRGRARFTTRTMLSVEQRMEAAAITLGGRQTHRVAADRLPDGAELGNEQRLALKHVTRARDLSVVVGHAGTGKSTMLAVARQAWEAQGYTVRGAALSGIAAEGLEGGAGIASRTVHSLLHAWEQGYDLLSSRDVLVVDEAGMIGSRQMERLLSAVEKAGAKLVLVGDPEQLQAIEAGAAFRAIAERVGAVEITEGQRHRHGWQREATRELATGRTAAALDRYAAAGMVHGHADLDAAKAAVVAGWDAARRERPETSQIILAYRRDDVRDLNERARAVRRQAGEMGEDRVLATERGERVFAEGDRVYFLRNDRGLEVKNGTLGTVERIADDGAGGTRLTVRLDGRSGEGGRLVSFDLADYAHIDHGYAATVHKSQGVTVDAAHVLASRLMDRHAVYVGLSRHRDSVQLHWSEDEFGSRDRLAAVLGRERLKDTGLDYPDRDLGLGGDPAGQAETEREDLVRAYGERRGFSMPQSEIVVPQPERPARRGLFAGLKLNAGSAGAKRPEPVEAERREGVPSSRSDFSGERLAQALIAYARAWWDALRMRQARLPVLPHQEQAMQRGKVGLEAISTGLSRDTRAVLERTPALARGVEMPGGVAMLSDRVAVERGNRLVLEERGRAAVRRWDALEQEYDSTVGYDARQEVGKRMAVFAKALKAETALDALLRERGHELGIEEGSRLERVVRTPNVRELTRELNYELGLGRGMGLGR